MIFSDEYGSMASSINCNYAHFIDSAHSINVFKHFLSFYHTERVKKLLACLRLYRCTFHRKQISLFKNNCGSNCFIQQSIPFVLLVNMTMIIMSFVHDIFTTICTQKIFLKNEVN